MRQAIKQNPQKVDRSGKTVVTSVLSLMIIPVYINCHNVALAQSGIDWTPVPNNSNYQQQNTPCGLITRATDEACANKGGDECRATKGCKWALVDISHYGCQPTDIGEYNDGNGVQQCYYPPTSTTHTFDLPFTTDESGLTENKCYWRIMCDKKQYWDNSIKKCQPCGSFITIYPNQNRIIGNLDGSITADGRGEDCSSSNLDKACPICPEGSKANASRDACLVYVYLANGTYNAIWGQEDTADITVIFKKPITASVLGEEANSSHMYSWDEMPDYIMKGNASAQQTPYPSYGGKLSKFTCYKLDNQPTENSTQKLNFFNSGSSKSISLGDKITSDTFKRIGPYVLCLTDFWNQDSPRCDEDYYCDGIAPDQGIHKCPEEMYTNGTGAKSVNDCKILGTTDAPEGKTPTVFTDSKGSFSLPFTGYIGP